ncbi:MAG: hypothetical protein M1834_002802 [Cirrosporium novae-zelandiae]|nr:MAG: hypothetical protein M1834_002802 [Cirrosporium novae-zelandiae]
MYPSVLLTCAVFMSLSKLSVAGYTLEDDYSTSNFFSMFDFFTETDPTNGFVEYVDQSTAQSSGLISNNGSSIYMGVDHTNFASSSGRQSVRITSTKSYNHGLVILDLAHMPGSVCGSWPAFWMVGPDWPSNGEIDIIEGVNSQTTNDMTLHTGVDCSISNTSSILSDFSTSSKVTSTNCDVSSGSNTGCQIASTETNTYGDGFNSAGGGVYATEWTSDAITIWFFSQGSVPSDISSGSPDPSSWGTPISRFPNTSCDIDSKFKNQQIVFDTTFCGDWAGNVWSSDSTCSAKASTCQDYVQNNPSAFESSYWQVNSLKVYQSSGSSNNSTASGVASASVYASVSATLSSAPTAYSVAISSISAPAIPSAQVPAASSAQQTTLATYAVAGPTPTHSWKGWWEHSKREAAGITTTNEEREVQSQPEGRSPNELKHLLQHRKRHGGSRF